MAELKFTGFYTSTYKTGWSGMFQYLRKEVEKISGMTYTAIGAQEQKGAAESMGDDGWHLMSLTYDGPAEKASAFREACVTGIAKYKKEHTDPVLLDGPFGELYVDGSPFSAPDMLVVEV